MVRFVAWCLAQNECELYVYILIFFFKYILIGHLSHANSLSNSGDPMVSNADKIPAHLKVYVGYR